MVYNLPSSFPEENKPSRKRKCSHNDDIGASFLTPAVSQNSIVLSAHSDDSSWNYNLNNSNTFLKSFLSMRQNAKGGFSSHSPSPVPFDMRIELEGGPSSKMSMARDLPKIGRPRSKSTADKPKKRLTIHSRSKSIEDSSLEAPILGSSFPLELKLNSNNNNSELSSPPQLFSIPYTSFKPLPITPPRNPFEGSSQKLNPKTLKQLQRNA